MHSPSRTCSTSPPVPVYDVSVITSGHDVADARLHRIVAAFVRAGLSVEVLATGMACTGPPGAQVRTWPKRGLVARAARAAILPWRAGGAVLLTLDPDSALGAALAGIVRRRRHVADVHEDYAELLRDRAWARGWRGRIAVSVVRLAVRATERADLTIVADEHLPPPADRCRRRLVVPNLPDLTMVKISSGGADAGTPRAVYIGDVRRSRGLETMVEAVATAPSWVLDIVGPVDTRDAMWLDRRIRQADVAGRIRLWGRQPPEAAWRIAEGADVGLALLDETPAFRAALPTKVYEYLAAGMAVLATPLPRVTRLLSEVGAGKVVRDAPEAASVLRCWGGAGSGDLHQLQAAAWSWRTVFARSRSPYQLLAEELVTMSHEDGHTNQLPTGRRRTIRFL